MDHTSLGLGGVPRAGVLYDSSVSGPSRPDAGLLTELGLAGFARSPQTFDPKAPGEIPPRADGEFTELGLAGLPGQVADYAAKRSTVGIVGSIHITVTPSGTISVGRRYYTPTDLVVSIKPIGATITVAHTNVVHGSVKVSVTPMAGQLKYTRFGANNAVQGNASIEVTPFGYIRYRRFRWIAGSVTFTVTPKAKLTYTPAPVRNHHVTGKVTTRVRPAGQVAFSANGIPYSVAGGTTLTVTPRGKISVVRKTTYAVSGRITITVTPHGAVWHGTGEPQAYHINGSTTFSVTPHGIMGLLPGITRQYAILGRAGLLVQPRAKITVRRAPSVTPIGRRGGRRRFIRIFR